MPSKEIKISEFNENQKADKALFIIQADLECLLKKVNGYKNNPKNSFITNLGEHIPSDVSMYTISSSKSIESVHNVYTDKDCMKKFCKSLRDNSIKMINFKRNKN